MGAARSVGARAVPVTTPVPALRAQEETYDNAYMVNESEFIMSFGAGSVRYADYLFTKVAPNVSALDQDVIRYTPVYELAYTAIPVPQSNRYSYDVSISMLEREGINERGYSAFLFNLHDFTLVGGTATNVVCEQHPLQITDGDFFFRFETSLAAPSVMLSFDLVVAPSYAVGVEDGKAEGYDAGYSAGYERGHQIGLNENYENSGLLVLFNAILASPMYIIGNAFDFEFFGINFKAVILFFISISIVLLIVGIFKKGSEK